MNLFFTRLKTLIAIIALMCSMVNSAHASHFMGFDLTYSCIGPNQYRIVLKAYRDCRGISMPGTFSVNYRSASCGVNATITLARTGFSDITPLCPSQTSACGGSGAYGVELHTYQGTLTLPPGCNDWILSTSSCCRNNMITNLTNPGSNNIYVETRINNTVNPCNSSPVFASEPTPFTCVNQTVRYQQLATDPDGDSLVYSLVNCQNGSGSNVTYAAGFSGVNPLTVPISLDPLTGELTFTANTPQVAVICVRVQEFRAGILIGEIIRDMQFVIQNCSNILPDLSGLNGSATVFDTATCAGSTMCFDVLGSDLNASNNITMSASGLPAGATFTVTGTGNNQVGRFCWTTTVANIGTHVFSVNVRDDACPIPGQNSRAYTLIILPNPNPPVNAGPDVDLCAGSSAILTATSAAPNAQTYTWSPPLGLSTTNGPVTTATPTGTTNYTVQLQYSDGCVSTDDVRVTVLPDPVANVSPSNGNVCAGGGFSLVGSTNLTGMNFQWFDPTMTSLGTGTVSGTFSSINVTVPTTPGNYNYTVRITNPISGCSTDAIATLVVGSPPPLPSCVNIYASTTGTVGAAGTQADPTTLAEALTRAACQNAVIKLATGTYNINNALFLSSFVTIEGGFIQASAWTKTSVPGATTINRTTANPEGAVNAQRLVAFYGNSVSGFRLQDLTITTANANLPGMSTYGLHLTNCSGYNIVRTQILPGAAAQGATGGAGTNGLAGANGAQGNSGSCDGGECTFGSGNPGGAGGSGGAGGGGPAGGAGGLQQNGVQNNGTAGTAATGRNGGSGGGAGAGGDECSNNNAGNGAAGGASACATAGTGGARGAQGNPGGDGANGVAGGAGTNGTIGAGGPAGAHVGGFWLPGTQAGTGTDGCGGAGGGGGGGGGRQTCSFCDDGPGNGGGGGGGGGQGGTGGLGGLGGGSSFGIYLFNNGAGGNIIQSRIIAGTAGAGGIGGAGGTGGNGGTGGPRRTTCTSEIGEGGAGGNGGRGGDGGQGGTGASGVAINVHLNGGSALLNNQNAFNLAAQPEIQVSNINCTNTNVTYTAAAPAAWDFDVLTNFAIPATATAVSPTITQYSQIGRFTVGMGANTYEGFHNIAFSGSIIPQIATNAVQLSADTFQLCQGSFAVFESMAFGDTYIWNFNGAIPNPGNIRVTPSTQFNNPGFYTVTLGLFTDCCGLSPTDTIYLFVDPLPTVTGSGNVAICEGNATTLTLTGLAATDSVIWSPTSNIISTSSNSITVDPLSTTLYTATIYSQVLTNGLLRLSCPITINFTVTVNGNPTINFAGTSPTCNDNGQITATASGTPGNFNFNWSNGASTLNNTVSTNGSLAVGLYTVTATHSTTGCFAVDSFFLMPGAGAPVIFLQNNVPAGCSGNQGEATVNTIGGTAPFNYLWNTGQTTTTRTGLTGGSYSVTVTDGAGCTSSVDFTIFAPEPVAINVIGFNNPGCASTGAIEVEGVGGTGNISYLWNNSATTTLISGLAAGTYTVTATDINGCSGIVSQILNAVVTNPTLSPAVVTPIACFGGTADIRAGAANGQLPFTYTWSGGSSLGFPTDQDTVSAATAGGYGITATDAGGCSITGTITVTEPSQLVVDADSTDVLCFSENTGTVSVNISGGTPGYSFIWNNTATTVTVNNLVAGIYTITVTDNNACTATSTTTINQPASAVSVTVAGIDDLCASGGGSASAVGSGGTPIYIFEWSSGPLTSNITGLATGTYTVTITDENGCEATASTSITAPSALTASAVTTADVLCNAGNNGAIDLTVGGATAPYSFSWSNGATTEDLTGLTAGTYTVTVSDANLCTRIVSATVTEPSAITLTTVVTNSSCFGSDNGSVDLTVSGGTPGYSFSWSNAAISEDINSLSPNTYTVTITDGNSCTATRSVTVTEPVLLTASTTQVNVSCFGGNNGSINLTVGGGTTPYSFNWGGGIVSEDRTGLTAGTYTVTVTDANFCTTVTAVTITQPTILTSSATQVNVSCFGGNNGSIDLTVGGGTAPYSFNWGAGIVSEDRTNLTAGTYTVTVTDGNSCTTVTSVTITQPTAITATTVSGNVSCFNGNNGFINLTVSGGTVPYSFNWGAGITSEDRTGLTAGTYTVTVTDGNGCTLTRSATITQPSVLGATTTQVNVSCFGGNNGAVNLTVTGGTTPYSYNWTGGVNTEDRTGLSAGTYSVTVTDANFCTTVTAVTITQPAQLSASNTFTNISCFGGTNGSVNLTVTGGTQPYAFNWSNGRTTEDINTLSAGTYTVTVTDLNGCSITSTAVITQPAQLSASTTQVNVQCNGTSTGSINLTVAGGTLPYAFNWGGGVTTEDRTGLSAGTYNVVITDANGCSISTSAIISQPAATIVTFTRTDVSCFGGNNGSATASVSGGVAPYLLSWSNGANTASINNLSAGTYTLTVTDANGCQTVRGVTVQQPATAVTANILSVTNNLCFGGTTGAIDADALGGTPNYTFLWSTGATTQDISGLPAGNYSLTATDAVGCTATASTVISQPTQLNANTSLVSNFNGAAISCPGAADGAITSSASGGVAPYSFVWSTNQNTPSLSGLTAGTYTLTVTDANGCSVIRSITLNDPVQLQANEQHVDVFCHGDCDGQIIVTAVAGTGTLGLGGYEYRILGPGQVGNVFSNINNFTALCAGNYVVEVRDGNGCQIALPITINPTNCHHNIRINNPRHLQRHSHRLCHSYSERRYCTIQFCLV
jgi:hypothetical protein